METYVQFNYYNKMGIHVPSTPAYGREHLGTF